MRDEKTSHVADDLVIEALQTLWPASIILAWVWTAGVMLAAPRWTVAAWAVFASLCGAVGVSHFLARRRLRASVCAYVAGLAGALSAAAILLADPALLSFLALVVVVAVMLLGERATWIAALACTALALAIGWQRLNLPWPSLAPQVALIWLTAFIAWLSSRGLLTALTWALNMTREAQRNAQEAQDSRAQAQLALKSLDEAYVRLERATEALMFSREAAEKAYRFKADFVANVSHELRTPLNLIVGFSEMMALAPESYGGVELPRAYRGDVMAIYRSARHLSDLINDVLDLSQIEAGRMPTHREPADLAQVVHEAADIVRGWAEARQLRLVVECPDRLPPMRLDRTRIRQVLLNLLTNATRFTDAGWIRVRVRLDGAEAVVEVQDSGPGIPRENLSRAFEAFGQMGSDRAREGSGLGLAISRRFVELHGGRMWIHSEVGRGTTVGFALPAPDGDRDGPLPILTRLPMARGKDEAPAVVVQHGDARVASVLERYLDGFRFVRAADGPTAACLARETGAAAVIQDGLLAEPAAAGAAAELPPQVAVIDCPLPSMRRLGLALGAADYLAKPVTRDHLLSLLGRLPEPPNSILVADDDPDVVRLLSRILKTELPACQVFEVFDGGKALEIARSRRPDLILLDLLMPGLSGYDVLREIGAAPELAVARVIVISARALEQESALLEGQVRVSRPAGFTATEIVQLAGAVLSVVTQPNPALAAMAPALSGTQPG
jgi:signal transduction histidine kinase/CheY-like chemotaxis protein